MTTLCGAGRRVSSRPTLCILKRAYAASSATLTINRPSCSAPAYLLSGNAQRSRWQTTGASAATSSSSSSGKSSVMADRAAPTVKMTAKKKKRLAKAREARSRVRDLLNEIDEELPPDRTAGAIGIAHDKQGWKERQLNYIKACERKPKKTPPAPLRDMLRSIPGYPNEDGLKEGEKHQDEEAAAENGRNSLEYQRHAVLSWDQPKQQDQKNDRSTPETKGQTEGEKSKQKYLWPDVVTKKGDAGAQQSKDRAATQLFTGEEASRKRRLFPQQGSEGVAEVESWQKYYKPWDQIPRRGSQAFEAWNSKEKWTTTVGGKLSANDVLLEEVPPLRPMDVPQLAHGLDRVLFNPGIHWLRDVRSGIYNFNPKLRDLYDVDLFDYSALPPYQTSSVDPELADLAKRHSKPYSGSTSSLTALLSQIYFCISAWKSPPLKGFTEGFQKKQGGFAFGAKLPANVILKRFADRGPDGSEETVRYAVDSAKSVANEPKNVNYVLTQLGKSVEKMLTATSDEYEKYLRINSHILSEEEKNKKEAYYYSMTDKFLLRSQLDCSDDRLPRKTFDLKTRAVIAIRMDRANWVESSGYTIRHNTGVYESFEREMWDLSRGTLLKYFFQARIGNMDGILVAYHSTSTMFGFQYLSREELAQRLFGSEEMGEQAFKLCIGMLEKILDSATAIFPDESLHITMDAQGSRRNPSLEVYVRPESSVTKSGEDASASEDASANDDTPVGENEANDEAKETERRNILLLKLDVDRYLSDSLVQGPVDFEAPKGYSIDPSSEDEIKLRARKALPLLSWDLEYSITPCTELSEMETSAMLEKVLSRPLSTSSFQLPNVEALNERERARQEALQVNPEAWKKFLEDRRTGVAAGMPPAPGQVILIDDDVEIEEANDPTSPPWSEMTEEEDEEGKTSVKVMHDHHHGLATEEEGRTNTDLDSASTHSFDDEDGIATTEEEEAGEGMRKSRTAAAENKRELPPHLQSDSVTWIKSKGDIERLRRLAQLGQQDRDELAKTDPMELYERRGD